MAKWISVKDRLPAQNKQVIVCWTNHRPAPYYKDIKDKDFVSTAVFFRGSWYWWDCRIEDLLDEYGRPFCGMDVVDGAVEITHWMPLPEPPKEVE